jgi:two-component system sensor histidine kinase HydH
VSERSNTVRWYRNRHLISLVGMVAAACLLVAAFVLGLVSFGKMRQVVAGEFNEQQLVLARNLATLIRQDLDFLKRELLVLNQSPLIQPESGGDWPVRMKAALASVEGGELLEVRFVNAAGTATLAIPSTGPERVVSENLRETSEFRWATRPENRGSVLMSSVRHEVDVQRSALTLLMVTPHVGSAGTPVPGAYPGFEGALVFVVDASALACRFTADARSGATGYAWVIDDSGAFLAHPMTDFIGKNAFTARHQKDPHLGFESINVIMRDHMLRGQEGVGEYESGWHRQMVGPVSKLIGYSPIRLDSARPWSVAVVAPVSEVQGMVRALLLRQLLVQSAIVLAILAGSISLLRMERYWANVRKEKERQINLSSRLASLGTLAAGVAHEVNNPIAIVLGFTDLLLEKTPPGTEAHEHLRIIERQATACKRIVENLGTFARVPATSDGKVDVNDELRRVLQIVKNTLLTEKIQCEADLEDGLPPARGDAPGLQQVLLNLISNARAAMKSGGKLTLRTRRAESKVVIEVSDTGHGIRRADLERIFDPFFTTKAPGQGVGLGLSLSHGIIEKAGGTISVESHHETDVGRERAGTTFRISLPVVGLEAGTATGEPVA